MIYYVVKKTKLVMWRCNKETRYLTINTQKRTTFLPPYLGVETSARSADVVMDTAEAVGQSVVFYDVMKGQYDVSCKRTSGVPLYTTLLGTGETSAQGSV